MRRATVGLSRSRRGYAAWIIARWSGLRLCSCSSPSAAGLIGVVVARNKLRDDDAGVRELPADVLIALARSREAELTSRKGDDPARRDAAEPAQEGPIPRRVRCERARAQPSSNSVGAPRFELGTSSPLTANGGVRSEVVRAASAPPTSAARTDPIAGVLGCVVRPLDQSVKPIVGSVLTSPFVERTRPAGGVSVPARRGGSCRGRQWTAAPCHRAFAERRPPRRAH